MKYIGEYISATTSQSGCVSTFMSEPAEEATFPSNVVKACDNCKKVEEHLFKLNKTHAVGTPKQMKTIYEWCEERGIEVDVKVQ